MIQKVMKLCDCPVDVCRADMPPENCRFVMDPHDKQRQMAKELARKLKRVKSQTPKRTT